MANNLYNQLSNNNGFIQQQPFQQLFNQFGGIQEMLNKFNYFKNFFKQNLLKLLIFFISLSVKLILLCFSIITTTFIISIISKMIANKIYSFH